MTEPCTSFAPGRALPQGECERCHFQRNEHLLEHRSLPSGKVLQPEAVQGEVVPRLLVKPDVVYCRGCGAGLIIKPPTDPDTWPCPQCGHVGPKSGHPSVTAEQVAAPTVRELLKKHGIEERSPEMQQRALDEETGAAQWSPPESAAPVRDFQIRGDAGMYMGRKRTKPMA